MQYQILGSLFPTLIAVSQVVHHFGFRPVITCRYPTLHAYPKPCRMEDRGTVI